MIERINAILLILGYTLHVIVAGVGVWAAWRHGVRPPWSVVVFSALVLLGSSQHTNHNFSVVWSGTLGAWAVGVAWRPRRWLVGLGMVVGASMVVEWLVTGERPGVWLGPGAASSIVLVAAAWAESRWWLWPVVIGGSRAALLGGGWVWATRWRWPPWVIGVLVAVALALGAWYRPATVVVRARAWAEAVSRIAERPVLGWGLGAWFDLGTVEPGAIHVDSAPLTVAVELGLVGLAVAAWVCVDVWRSIRHHPAAWGVAAWAVMQLADHTLYMPYVGLALGVSVGMMWEVTRIIKR